jgi:hypothetical protein
MIEGVKAKPILIGMLAAGLLMVFALWALLPSLVCTHVKTPRELGIFLDSPRDDMRCVKVNQHLLEIGKRPSVQVIKGYNKIMFQMRPYRQVHFKFRNLTKAEAMDFCTNITADGLEDLRAKVASGKGFTPIWEGRIQGGRITVVRVTMFSYLITGLADKPVFMGQVELAKRLGMDDATLLNLIIPAQDRWLQDLSTNPSMDSSYPLQYLTSSRDELVEWLGIPQV